MLAILHAPDGLTCQNRDHAQLHVCIQLPQPLALHAHTSGIREYVYTVCTGMHVSMCTSTNLQFRDKLQVKPVERTEI